MEQLPDNLLLMVMKYLKLRDLFTCRRVCKKIGDLAMFPEVWRHRRVGGWLFTITESGHWLCPVLRLAPCLAEMQVVVDSSGACCPQYTTTRCAVAKLKVFVDASGDAGEAVGDAPLVIRNQEALGRLRSLTLVFSPKVSGAEALRVLRTVASTCVLEELGVSGQTEGVPGVPTTTKGCHTFVHSRMSSASLKRFVCHLEPEGPFYNFVLAEHAATLEDVDFRDVSLTSTSTAPLLAALPKLRKLTCRMLPRMEALAACEALKWVTLWVTEDMASAAPAATAFLGAATQLQRVTLVYDSDADSPTGVGVGLVMALAASGCSGVSHLAIRMTGQGCPRERPHFPQLQSLVSALPLLPRLRRLDVDTAADELLLAIRPDTTPALRTLLMHPSHYNCPNCNHAWQHKKSLRTLLSANPSLDVYVYDLKLDRPFYCEEGKLCEACALGCHKELQQDTDTDQENLVIDKDRARKVNRFESYKYIQDMDDLYCYHYNY